MRCELKYQIAREWFFKNNIKNADFITHESIDGRKVEEIYYNGITLGFDCFGSLNRIVKKKGNKHIEINNSFIRGDYIYMEGVWHDNNDYKFGKDGVLEEYRMRDEFE